MNERHPSEYDLHAYLDGQLDDERQRWVEAWLATQPERAAEVPGVCAPSTPIRSSGPTTRHWTPPLCAADATSGNDDTWPRRPCW